MPDEISRGEKPECPKDGGCGTGRAGYFWISSGFEKVELAGNDSFLQKDVTLIPLATVEAINQFMDSKLHKIDSLPELQDLLRRYSDGEEEAFAKLVNQLSGLIYHGAFRRIGNHALAQEVTQSVFLIMARKAKALSRHQSFLAWVHETTRLETLQLNRANIRRKRREREAVKIAELEAKDEGGLKVMGYLDQSLDRLTKGDRELVLMKYFEGRTYDEITRQTGRSVSAEKMRLKRALEKMADWMGKKGVVLSLAAVGALLSSEMSKAAPTGVVKVVSAGMKLGSVSGGKVLLNSLETGGSIKVIGGVVLAVSMCTAIPATFIYQEIQSLTEQKANLLNQEESNVSEQGISKPKIKLAAEVNGAVDALLDPSKDSIDLDQLALEFGIASNLNDELRRYRNDQIVSQFNLEELRDLALAMNRSEVEGVRRPRYFLERYFPKDWTESEQILFSISINEYSGETTKLFGRWMKRAPEEAMAWLDEYTGTSYLQSPGASPDYEWGFWTECILDLAKSSPEKAVNMMKELKPYQKGEGVEADLVELIAPSNLSLAIQLAKSAQRDSRHRCVGRIVGNSLSIEDKKNIGEWIDRHGFNESDLESVVPQILWGRGNSYHPKSVEEAEWWIEKHVPVSDRDEIRAAYYFPRFMGEELYEKWLKEHATRKQRDLILQSSITESFSGFRFEWNLGTEKLDQIASEYLKISSEEIKSEIEREMQRRSSIIYGAEVRKNAEKVFEELRKRGVNFNYKGGIER